MTERTFQASIERLDPTHAWRYQITLRANPLLPWGTDIPDRDYADAMWVAKRKARSLIRAARKAEHIRALPAQIVTVTEDDVGFWRSFLAAFRGKR